MRKGLQIIIKKKFIISFIAGAILCFLCTIFWLFCILPNKHDHQGDLKKYSWVKVYGKITDCNLDETGGRMYLEVAYWEYERGNGLEKAVDNENVRIPVHSGVIIKNKLGWKVDVSYLSEGASVIACVPNLMLALEEKRFVDCYEIWIQ